MKKQSHKISVYTTTNCPSCETLKKWLDQQKISYEVINIEEDPKEQAFLFKKTGSFLVPVTIIVDRQDKEVVVYGTKYAQIKKALGRT